MATKEELDGWDEPLVEGLWRPDLLWEIPRNLNWLHLIWVVLAVFDSLKWLMMIGIVHAALAWLTKRDQEWPETVRDFFREPLEMDV